MTKRVIIDTDPGLDDAVAILFALASSKFDVLGLTTVAGNIGLERTTFNAGSLLAAVGRGDIPVISGAATALVRANIHAAVVHGNDGLGGLSLPRPMSPHGTDAASWMARILLAEPGGKIDILALGPLTNIAHLIERHPEASTRMGRLIVMGGAIYEPGNAGPASEFNFACDPEATARVLGSDIKTTIIPLDVTRRVRADRNYVEALRGSAAGNVAADLLAAYLQDEKTSRPLHDPCVMLLALQPELFDLETIRLSVNVGSDADAGALTVSDSGSTVSVAMRVDVAGVLDLLASGLR